MEIVTVGVAMIFQMNLSLPIHLLETLSHVWQQAQHEVAAKWVVAGEFNIPERPILLEHLEPHVQDNALALCKELGIEVEYPLEACAIDVALLDVLTFDREDIKEIQEQLGLTKTFAVKLSFLLSVQLRRVKVANLTR
ncbi:MAG: hypothetical protein R2880_06675 [Deinococcales bacterium]